MSRLPVPGADAGVWAEILNDFLEVSLANDGTLNANTVGTMQIQNASITDQQIDSVSQSKVTNLQIDMNSLSGKNVSLVTKASGFIQNMLSPLVTLTTPSTIRLDHVYDVSYTGPVSGSFDLLGVSPATVQLCPIVITTPVGTIPDSYFGTVTGAITNYSGLTNGPYTVQSYKTTDMAYEQPSSTTVNDDGTFILDLSTTPDTRAGTWSFALLDTDSNPVGQPWPQVTSYTDLILQHSVVTDTTYPVSSVPLTTDGQFSFLATRVGLKLFQIVDSSSAILAQSVAPVTNVRSYLVAAGEPGYGTSFPTYSYTYDQSIALLAMLAEGNLAQAQTLAAGLLAVQTTSGAQAGGFPFSAPQLSLSYSSPYYRTGAHAFATYALLAYVAACPEDTTSDYQGAITQAFSYIATQLSTSGTAAGLYLGGSGEYTDPPGQPEIFNQSYNVAWAATEHNLDVWQAFNLAARVLGDSSYQTLANTLEANIMSLLWDSKNQRFYQGMDPTGPDSSDPLDMHSWGGIWLCNTGRTDLAAQVLSETSLAPFVVTDAGVTGYTSAYASGGYPGIIPSVWSEGTFGVALAFLALGDTVNWQATVDGIAGGQRPDGSFRYVTETDTTYEFTVSESTIGAAWAILAVLGCGIWGITAPRSSSTD